MTLENIIINIKNVDKFTRRLLELTKIPPPLTDAQKIQLLSNTS